MGAWQRYKLNAVLVILGGFVGGFVGSITFQKLPQLLENKDQFAAVDSVPVKLPVQEESQTTDAVQKAKPSVVSIAAYKEVSLFNQTGSDVFYGGMLGTLPVDRTSGSTKEKQEVSAGSGFIIGQDGLILTNRHVVSDESAEYHVVLNDGTDLPAIVLARDTINDLAFVKIDPKDLKLQPIDIGDSDQIKIGETVIAIGNTLSEYSNTVTKGVVSGINRKVSASGIVGDQSELDQAIQTDAAINPGNSGGPLINLAGQVVGINTAVDRGGEGIGFAIPINEAKALVDEVKLTGKIIRPFLGVRYVLINDKIAKHEGLSVDHGAYIISDPNDKTPTVIKGSPADQVGLKEGDVIYQVNGKDVTVDQGLSKLLANYKPQTEVELKVMRKDMDMTLKATLADRDDFKDK